MIARKDPATDPFPHTEDGVVCVEALADRAQIERTSAKLCQIGLTPSAWKSEQQTRSDWQAGGNLALQEQLAEKQRELRAADADEKQQWDIFISENSCFLEPESRVTLGGGGVEHVSQREVVGPQDGQRAYGRRRRLDDRGPATESRIVSSRTADGRGTGVGVTLRFAVTARHEADGVDSHLSNSRPRR